MKAEADTDALVAVGTTTCHPPLGPASHGSLSPRPAPSFPEGTAAITSAPARPAVVAVAVPRLVSGPVMGADLPPPRQQAEPLPASTKKAPRSASAFTSTVGGPGSLGRCAAPVSELVLQLPEDRGSEQSVRAGSSSPSPALKSSRPLTASPGSPLRAGSPDRSQAFVV